MAGRRLKLYKRMAMQEFISVIVFVLFIQKGIYGLLSTKIAYARSLFFLSVYFACWSLSDVVLPMPEARDAFRPFDPVGLLGWSFLPLFTNWSLSHLVNHPTEPLKRRAEMLVLFLAGMPLALAASGHWIPGFDRFPLFRSDGPWPYFLALVLLVNAGYLLHKVYAWRKPQGENHISFRLVFLPLLLFLVISLALEFVLPLAIGPTAHMATPWPGIIWFAMLVHAMKIYDRALVNPVRAAPVVIDNLRMAVFLCNIDHSLSKMNPAAMALFDRIRVPGEGDPLPAIFADPGKVEAGLLEASANGQSGPLEVAVSTGDGSAIPLLANFYLVSDGFNDVHGLAVVCRDLRIENLLDAKLRMAKDESRELAGQVLLLEGELSKHNAELAQISRELQMQFSESLRMEEKIESDLLERDILINEIHNRVIYNMNLMISLVEAQGADHYPQAFRQKLLEMAQRVRSILLVHQHLYLSVNYSEVDFKGFLLALKDELLAFYDLKDQVETDIDLGDEFIDISRAIPLGIIANELISNALTHAWSGSTEEGPVTKKLKIGFSRLKTGWQMTIADNGKGLPGGLQTGAGQTIGLALVKILVDDQVGGKVKMRTRKGTSFRIEF